jgi:hypothetical protein
MEQTSEGDSPMRIPDTIEEAYEIALRNLMEERDRLVRQGMDICEKIVGPISEIAEMAKLLKKLVKEEDSE